MMKEKAVVGTTAAKTNGKELRIKDTKSVIDKLQNGVEDINVPDWQKYLITEEPEDIPALIEFGNTPIATPCNHSLLIGKKKTRKSLLLVHILSQYKGNIETDCLLVDTEQGKKHVWKMKERVKRLTGQNLTVLSLRGLSPDDRRKVIESALNDLPIKLLVIDGIRDLLSNINDPDQCTELVTWVESLTTTFGLHIINVLHMNKVDSNARGHIGSELTNKAEVTIELELNETAGCTIVKCESAREAPFEPFAFTHNDEGLPEIVSMPVKGEVITEGEKKARIAAIFEGSQLKYKDVIQGVMDQFGIGKNRAGHFLAEFLRRGWVVKNGVDRSPDTVYKCMVSLKAVA